MFRTLTKYTCTQFVLSTDTQRPARNPAIAQNPTAVGVGSTTPPTGVFNRFGGDDDTDVSAANAPAAVCHKFEFISMQLSSSPKAA